MTTTPAAHTGQLVVAASPGISIRGTCDYMGATTYIRHATCDADGGGLELEWGDGFKDFPEATITVTQDGYVLYEDESANTYRADELAILLGDGTLVPLKAERRPPAFVGDVEWAKRLVVAAEAALSAVGEGDLHAHLHNAINEAVQAVWGIHAPAATTRNDDTHRFEVRAKDSKGSVGWFTVQRHGRELARAHAIVLLTQMGERFELVERGRPDIEPGEFWRCAEGGYTVTESEAGVSPAVFVALDSEGDELVGGLESYPTERAAWEACDRHRMFGTAAPLDD
ncbi:MAG: hypothetical protein Q8R98_17825 [Rubrivivax sp.]|nr:hypothetical protein [Rubrivivax sp.]